MKCFMQTKAQCPRFFKKKYKILHWHRTVLMFGAIVSPVEFVSVLEVQYFCAAVVVFRVWCGHSVSQDGNLWGTTRCSWSGFMASSVKIHPGRGLRLRPQRSTTLWPPRPHPTVHSMSITGRLTVSSLIDLPCFPKKKDTSAGCQVAPPPRYLHGALEKVQTYHSVCSWAGSDEPLASSLNPFLIPPPIWSSPDRNLTGFSFRFCFDLSNVRRKGPRARVQNAERVLGFRKWIHTCTL